MYNLEMGGMGKRPGGGLQLAGSTGFSAQEQEGMRLDRDMWRKAQRGRGVEGPGDKMAGKTAKASFFLGERGCTGGLAGAAFRGNCVSLTPQVSVEGQSRTQICDNEG